MNPKLRYAPKPGAHITRAEAEVVGQTIASMPSGFTVDQFEERCRADKGALHRAWEVRRASFVEGAGRAAAGYLLRSVMVVCVEGPPAPERAVVLLPQPVAMREDEAEPEVTGAYTGKVVRRDKDLLKRMELEFERVVNGLVDEFVAVAGPQRAGNVVYRIYERIEG